MALVKAGGLLRIHSSNLKTHQHMSIRHILKYNSTQFNIGWVHWSDAASCVVGVTHGISYLIDCCFEVLTCRLPFVTASIIHS